MKIKNCLQSFSDFANEHKTNPTFLLLLNGVFGAIIGMYNSTWQISIETAQVLLGLTSYPADSLPYLYHASSFSLINNISAFFLSLTKSEIGASIAISALLDCIMQQTLAMVVFLMFRNIYIATIAALAIINWNFMGSGIAYPILFIGTQHTYGRIGMFYVIYAALFFAFARNRTGFFLSGIALWVHPLWGLFLNGCLAATFLLQYRHFKSLLQLKYLKYLAVGVAMASIAFVWQKIQFPYTAPVLSPEKTKLAREVFLSYIKYWDCHRQKWDDPKVLFEQLSQAGICVMLTAMMLKIYKNIPLAERFFYSWILISAPLCFILVIFPSWFDQSYFPQALIASMPGRFINLPIYLFSPLAVGALIFWVSRMSRKHFTEDMPYTAMACIFLISWGGVQFYGAGQSILNGTVLSILFLLIRIMLQSDYLPVYEQKWSAVKSYTSWLNWRLVNTVLAAIFIGLFVYKPIKTIRRIPKIEKIFTDTYFLPSDVHGPVLTTTENHMIQLKTRIGGIVPHIDGYAYLGPAALLSLNEMTTDLYGISLLDKPKYTYQLNRSIFSTLHFQQTWESRSCKEWEALAKQYHFDYVTVNAAMHLHLQPAVRNLYWNEYYPRCEHSHQKLK